MNCGLGEVAEEESREMDAISFDARIASQSALVGSRIINRMTKRQGKITAPSNLNIQEHEMAT